MKFDFGPNADISGQLRSWWSKQPEYGTRMRSEFASVQDELAAVIFYCRMTGAKWSMSKVGSDSLMTLSDRSGKEVVRQIAPTPSEAMKRGFQKLSLYCLPFEGEYDC